MATADDAPTRIMHIPFRLVLGSSMGITHGQCFAVVAQKADNLFLCHCFECPDEAQVWLLYASIGWVHCT
jgi:hypothetical protein